MKFNFVKTPIALHHLPQRGVSLLETISVVTIAGTLSAVAVPSLVDLPKEARISVIKSMEGAVFSASVLMHMKCALEASCDLNAGDFTMQTLGDTIKMKRGYPIGGDTNGISNALQYKGFTAFHTSDRTIFAKNGANDTQTCAVIYKLPAADGQDPVIDTLTSGC